MNMIYINKYDEDKNKGIIYQVSLGELQDDSDKRIKAWEMGYIKGQPDLTIMNKTYKYDGCVIEFKNSKGTGILSEAQESILDKYKRLKYKVILSNDFAEIISKLAVYFNKLRIPCEYCKRRFKNEKTLCNHKKYFHRL